MKKSYVAACLAVLVMSTVPGFAAQPVTTAAAGTAVGTTEFAKAQQPVALPESYSLVINGHALDVKQLPHALYTKHTAIMVPLKETAEALGYTVTWDKVKNCAHVDMAIASMDVYPGQDQYNRVGKLKNINLDMDAHYSVPADVWHGHLYVPAPMFRLFFNDVIMGSDAVQITVNKAELDTPGHTDENVTAAQKAAVADADKTPVEVVKGQANGKDHRGMWTGGPGVANPMCEYDTVAAMQEALQFPVVVPHGLAADPVAKLFTISKEIAQIDFANGNMYRMGKGSRDISGDYNVYPQKDSWTYGNVHITAYGDKGSYRSFRWHDGTYTYALSLAKAMTKDRFMALMK